MKFDHPRLYERTAVLAALGDRRTVTFLLEPSETAWDPATGESTIRAGATSMLVGYERSGLTPTGLIARQDVRLLRGEELWQLGRVSGDCATCGRQTQWTRVSHVEGTETVLVEHRCRIH